MKTGAVAGEIANYTIYQLKNEINQIGAMSVLEQENIRDIIRNAALHILNEYVRSPQGA